jgi:hypothetical protein
MYQRSEGFNMVTTDNDLELAIAQHFGAMGLDEHMFGESVKHSEYDGVDEVEEFFAHFGIKGMHWGVRKGDHPEATRKTNREAKKDANEFARAKLFYGEGAGTRRKLIKATVEAKSKQDPMYKKAFEHHLDSQDLGTHAQKARSERHRKDARAKVGKTARGVNRQLNGPFAAPIGAAAVAAAYGVAKAKGYDKTAYRAGASFIDKLFK